MNNARLRIGMILCGGRSLRMQVDKATLQLGGRTFLQRVIDALQPTCEHIVLVKRGPEQELPTYESTVSIEEIFDEHSDQGPVESLRIGLKYASQRPLGSAKLVPTGDASAMVFVSGCDTPLLLPQLVTGIFDRLTNYETAVPTINGKLYPLCAAYSTSSCDRVEDFYNLGKRRLTELVRSLNSNLLLEEDLKKFDPQLQSLLNINTPEEFRKLLQIDDAQ